MTAAESYVAAVTTPATTVSLTASDHIRSDVLSKARESCYKARNGFYACLDSESGTQKPTEIGSVGLLLQVSGSSTRLKASAADYS